MYTENLKFYVIMDRFQEIRDYISSSAFCDIGVKVVKLEEIFLTARHENTNFF